MKVRKDGIFKNIDPRDFGVYQAWGFEKVIIEPITNETHSKVVEPEPVVEIKTEEVEKVEEPIKEEKVDELPKSKKKKK